MLELARTLISPCTGKTRQKNKYTTTHKKCRSDHPTNLESYQGNNDIKRAYVREDCIGWDVVWPEYNPTRYTSPKVLANPVWADSEDVKSIKKWNEVDGKIDRRSHVVKYDLDENGYPLNVCGRTGICGRGQLGKWGPNHAADPIVTRWKRNENNKICKHAKTGKPILQFVAIKRLDTNEWAIPGGMCDPGEKISATLKREFMEEATDSQGKTKEVQEKIEAHLKKLFENGIEVFRGYVDDPRNTDNAWMETIAYNFHDEDNTVFKDFQLTAGDDAGSVKWMDIDENLDLYASHKDFIRETVLKHKAHW